MIPKCTEISIVYGKNLGERKEEMLIFNTSMIKRNIFIINKKISNFKYGKKKNF